MNAHVTRRSKKQGLSYGMYGIAASTAIIASVLCGSGWHERETETILLSLSRDAALQDAAGAVPRVR